MEPSNEKQQEIKMNAHTNYLSIRRSRPWFKALLLLSCGLLFVRAQAGDFLHGMQKVERKQQPQKASRVARQAPPVFDRSGIGGSVFATGLGPVTVTVHHVGEFLSDRMFPYPMQVFWANEDQLRLLGSNYQHRTLSLGKLPRGE